MSCSFERTCKVDVTKSVSELRRNFKKFKRDLLRVKSNININNENDPGFHLHLSSISFSTIGQENQDCYYFNLYLFGCVGP